MAARDTQIGGEHYTSLPIQPWDALQAWLTPEQFQGHLLGTAITYLARSDHKADRLEDWKKARHTLDKLIETAAFDEAKVIESLSSLGERT